MGPLNISYPLPPDVFFVIIDILASDLDSPPLTRLEALIALSVTCRMLLEPSRKHLFRTVTIRTWVHRPTWMVPDSIPSISFEAMESVLRRNPSIANCIRTLNCQLYPLDFKDIRIGNILRKFTRLRSLTLMAHERVTNNCTDHDSETDSDEADSDESESDEINKDDQCDTPFINWRHMSQHLRDSLRTLLQLPTLSSLELQQIVNFPPEVLALSRGLLTLNIFRCHIAHIPFFVPFLPSKDAIPLRELRIIPGAASNVKRLKELLPGGIPVLNISQIREISFTFTTEFYAPQLGELLEDLLHLETLTLTFKGISRDFPEWLGSILEKRARRCLNNLRNLRIRREILEDPYTQPRPYFFEVLQDISSFNELQNVDIYIKVYPEMTPILTKDLEELAMEFSTVSKYPALETVSISICLDQDGESSDSSEDEEEKEDRAEVKADVRRVWKNVRTTHLKPLSDIGTVRLTYSVKDVEGNRIV